uniref:Uncharacterized protein n=1 Tax=Ananas comosus var. bracteatus TaxID=296719 RepID=A0A6V7PUY7_ANACO|nr:unnamed protein product [Ananas comosus var. bracteatus]
MCLLLLLLPADLELVRDEVGRRRVEAECLLLLLLPADPRACRPSSWYGTRWVAAVSRPSSLRPCRPSSWYGIVYRGVLADHSVVAVKYLLDNKGQAEKEFKVEVEVIGKFLELFKLFGNSSRSKGRRSPQSTKP